MSAAALDLALPFQVDACGMRGRLVRLGPALARMLRDHDYPPAVAEALGEAVALAAVLASSLKYEGVFTLQTQGDGPLSVLVVDVTSDGVARGHARFDRDRLAALEGEERPSVPRLLGAGHLAFTVDQGPDTERYQGIVPLEGATLADCAHAYFRTSEQLATAIVLVARGEAAGALMVQRLPPEAGRDEAEAEEDWRRGVILASSVRTSELLDADLAPERLLHRLYHQEGLRVFAPRPLSFGCRCSRERVGGALRVVPRADLESMMDDGRLTVTCEFCRAEYVVTTDDLEALLAAPEADSRLA